MSEDKGTEHDELEEEGELPPTERKPVFLEPDPKTYEEEWSPEDPPPGI
jgi:hypothetical protein